MADYRKPIILKTVREAGGVFGIHREHNEVEAEIDVSTDDGKRAMELLKTGLACANCYQTFPARPGPDTLKDFEPTFNLFPIDLTVQRERIKGGACNLCGFVGNQENIEKTVYDEAMTMAKRLYEQLGDGS